MATPLSPFFHLTHDRLFHIEGLRCRNLVETSFSTTLVHGVGSKRVNLYEVASNTTTFWRPVVCKNIVHLESPWHWRHIIPISSGDTSNVKLKVTEHPKAPNTPCKRIFFWACDTLGEQIRNLKVLLATRTRYETTLLILPLSTNTQSYEDTLCIN